MNGNNIFSSLSGWVQINSEQVMTANPSVIIILTTNYSATQQEYDSIMNSLPAEWKATDAYKSREIYLVCETAGDMSLIPGPRFIQLMELTARILHPDVFDDIPIPKYIGNNYEDFLTFTKDLNFKE
jgi:iron complex transport system substrate-binding protein